MYVRDWPCAMCGEAVIIDSVAKRQSCGCDRDKKPSEQHQKSIENYMKTANFQKNYKLLCLS